MTSFSFRSRKWHPPLLSAKLPACLTCLNPANTPPVSPVFTVAQLQSTPWPPLASSSVVVINSCIDLYKKASSLRSKLPGSSCASTAKRHNLPDHYIDRHGVYCIPTLFSPTRIPEYEMPYDESTCFGATSSSVGNHANPINNPPDP